MPRQSRCANPLLLSWVEEWRDEEEEGSHKHMTYKRAADSLKKYPTVLEHPRDACEVRYIGAVIKDRLVKRWREHCAEEGLPDSQPSASGSSAVSLNKNKKTAAAKAKEPKKRGRPPKQSMPAFLSDSEDEERSSPPRRVALPVPNANAFVSPAVTANSIPFNDVVPGQFIFWYIDTDDKRVKKREHAEIRISETEGLLLYKLEYRMDQMSHELVRSLHYKEPTPIGRERDKSVTFFSFIKETDAERYEFCTAHLPTVSQSAASLLTKPRTMAIDPSRMLSPDRLEEMERARAAVRNRSLASSQSTQGGTRKDGIEAGSQGKPSGSQNPTSIKALEAALLRRRQSLVEDVGTSASTSTASSQPIATESILRRSSTSSALPKETLFQGPSFFDIPAASSAQAAATSRASFKPVANEFIYRTNSTPVPLPRQAPLASSFDVPPPLNRTVSLPGSRSRPNAPRLSSHIPVLVPVDDLDAELDFASGQAGTSAAPSRGTEDFTAFEPIVFPPRSYTIYLILDSREVKNQKQRDYISDKLRKKGVNVEKRGLALGDTTWIARRNGGGQGGEYDECVLDFVLERKRLDDLCLSIKDSRFHDQKFRLHTSGISHIYYLVEDYNKEQHKEQFGVQINTALSSTQIVDGLFVKETRSLEDTIEYLAGMHQTILELHEGKPLYVIPSALVRPYSYLEFQKHLRETQPSMSYLTTYSTFQSLNGKSTNTTLRNQWAKMLLCIKGLSAEKVATIIATYDTPHALWKAFREAEIREAEDVEREEIEAMDEDQVPQKGRKKARSAVRCANMLLVELEAMGRNQIGQALSKKIYDLFMSQEY